MGKELKIPQLSSDSDTSSESESEIEINSNPKEQKFDSDSDSDDSSYKRKSRRSPTPPRKSRSPTKRSGSESPRRASKSPKRASKSPNKGSKSPRRSRSRSPSRNLDEGSQGRQGRIGSASKQDNVENGNNKKKQQKVQFNLPASNNLNGGRPKTPSPPPYYKKEIPETPVKKHCKIRFEDLKLIHERLDGISKAVEELLQDARAKQGVKRKLSFEEAHGYDNAKYNRNKSESKGRSDKHHHGSHANQMSSTGSKTSSGHGRSGSKGSNHRSNDRISTSASKRPRIEDKEDLRARISLNKPKKY